MKILLKYVKNANFTPRSGVVRLIASSLIHMRHLYGDESHLVPHCPTILLFDLLCTGGYVITNHCARLGQASKPRLTLQSNRLHYVTAAHKPGSHWSA